MNHDLDQHIKMDVPNYNLKFTRRYKIIIICILTILSVLTIWESYLIINGALSSIKNPLSNNILDNVGILYVLWFVGVFIALAYKLDIMFDSKGLFDKKEKVNDEVNAAEKSLFRKYLLPSLSIFILIPIVSAIIIYYVIYYILFLFIGILPYIVGITLIIGLVYSFIKLPRLINKPKRGRKIIVFAILMILCYSFILVLMNAKKINIHIYNENSSKKELTINSNKTYTEKYW